MVRNLILSIHLPSNSIVLQVVCSVP
jgi:hypothetical protein